MAERRPFGPFVLDTQQASLLRDGTLLPISQYGVALLGALLDADCQTVSREALIARAWPDTIVEDGNLTVQIAALRKVLGERADGGEWIATVPRRGYRLLADDPIGPDPYPPIRRPSLAVLPFNNLSGDPAHDYLADGIVEDLITALNRFKSIGVVARNSSFIYKGRAVDVREVAKELGVRYVLEGSVRRAAGRQRVTAQLVDADSGEHIWARNFDGAAEDIFDVQDSIVEDVAPRIDDQILQAELQRAKRKHPANLDVYDLCLRAFADLRTFQLELHAPAFEMLMQALAMDPTYAPALGRAVWALGESIGDGWPPLTADDRALCLELAERGLAAAQGDAHVIVQCGLALIGAGQQYDRGVRIIRDAVALNPNSPVVLFYAAIAELHWGSVEKSIALNRRASLVAEGTFYVYAPQTGLAHGYIALGNYEDALMAAEKAHAVNPNWVITHWMLVTASAHLGRMDEARQWLAALQRMSPGLTITKFRAGQSEKIPGRMSPIYEGLRLAGLPEA